jgi:predicted nucleic acid-binding protein
VNAVFADTFFYLALLDERDPAHPKALRESSVNQPLVTTEFVLLELGNACRRAEDHADFLALLEGLRASPRVRIVPLSSDWLARGLEMFASRTDKDWSLTDCVSFAVMNEQGLREALTADHHFEQAGFTVLLK